MAGGTKPDTKLVLKNKTTGKTELTLASYWTEGRDMPSGGFDKSIKRIVVDWEDREGNAHRTVVDNRKDTLTHYCNLQIWKDDAPRAPAKPHPYRKPAADLPPDDLADDLDDIGF